jgi:hypothetical protein
MNGTTVDVSAVKDGEADSGVEFGAELLAFSDAVMARNTAAIETTRDSVAEALGADGVVDTAAVIAMFNVVDRIADATGIPIDDGFTHDLRYAIGSELEMDHLTPEERASR